MKSIEYKETRIRNYALCRAIAPYVNVGVDFTSGGTCG